jgi:hypothetical protein
MEGVGDDEPADAVSVGGCEIELRLGRSVNVRVVIDGGPLWLLL